MGRLALLLACWTTLAAARPDPMAHPLTDLYIFLGILYYIIIIL